MWSFISTSPYLKPSRLPTSRCGARVIDSIPPATTISTSPARISASAVAIAFSPERHSLLIVIAGTVIGMPALAAGDPGGALADPGLQHLPHDHVVDRGRVDVGLLQRTTDRHGPELRRREVAQRPQQPAHGGTGPRNNDGRRAYVLVGHGILARLDSHKPGLRPQLNNRGPEGNPPLSPTG